ARRGGPQRAPPPAAARARRARGRPRRRGGRSLGCAAARRPRPRGAAVASGRLGRAPGECPAGRSSRRLGRGQHRCRHGLLLARRLADAAVCRWFGGRRRRFVPVERLLADAGVLRVDRGAGSDPRAAHVQRLVGRLRRRVPPGSRRGAAERGRGRERAAAPRAAAGPGRWVGQPGRGAGGVERERRRRRDRRGLRWRDAGQTRPSAARHLQRHPGHQHAVWRALGPPAGPAGHRRGRRRAAVQPRRPRREVRVHARPLRGGRAGPAEGGGRAGGAQRRPPPLEAPRGGRRRGAAAAGRPRPRALVRRAWAGRAPAEAPAAAGGLGQGGGGPCAGRRGAPRLRAGGQRPRARRAGLALRGLAGGGPGRWAGRVALGRGAGGSDPHGAWLGAPEYCCASDWDCYPSSPGRPDAILVSHLRAGSASAIVSRLCELCKAQPLGPRELHDTLGSELPAL
ncbi:unnamed protein product, partial [Prorocentrum cordatum]